MSHSLLSFYKNKMCYKRKLLFSGKMQLFSSLFELLEEGNHGGFRMISKSYCYYGKERMGQKGLKHHAAELASLLSEESGFSGYFSDSRPGGADLGRSELCLEMDPGGTFTPQQLLASHISDASKIRRGGT